MEVVFNSPDIVTEVRKPTTHYFDRWYFEWDRDPTQFEILQAVHYFARPLALSRRGEQLHYANGQTCTLTYRV